MNTKSVMCVLCSILAIYGIIILIRKIMNRSEKNKEGKWSYYIEPYRWLGCKKCKECKEKSMKTCTDYLVSKAGSASKVDQDDIRSCMRDQSMVESICNCNQDKDIVCL